MWAKWASFYNRAKNANAALSLFERAWKLCAIVFGSAVLAWASRTWDWYWNAFSWAGVAFAFLVSWIGIALAVFLSGLGMYLWRNGRFRNLNAPRNTLGPNILKEKFVYGGSAPSVGRSLVLPSFKATFGLPSENVRIFVDEIYFLPLPGPPVHCTTKNHLLLKEIPRVSRDETISIWLLSQFDCDGQKLWRWGEGGAAEGQYLFLPKSIYQGRVRVVSAGQQACCYFIVMGMESDEGPPQVIGEHMFNFSAKWEAEDAKNAETSFVK